MYLFILVVGAHKLVFEAIRFWLACYTQYISDTYLLYQILKMHFKATILKQFGTGAYIDTQHNGTD